MATKEFALLNPHVACYFYSINEEKNLARVRFEPLKGAKRYPQSTSMTIAQARTHYLNVYNLKQRKGVM